MPIHVYTRNESSPVDIYEDADEWTLFPSGVLSVSSKDEDTILAAYNVEDWVKVLAVEEDDESEGED